ncbi:MAG: hypothetical protein A2Y65_05345 [Deltaproteobacteria bacterium RBG_13_52_11]|nr:MAG: hypothetical protein A2Y65_05345 [Deltaproteobacteria bacterium RBG_13_52_11]
MKKNMGTIDRVIRLVLAAVIAALYLTGTISGIVAIILIIIGVIFVLTSLIGFCPLYALFNMSTKPKAKKKKK